MLALILFFELLKHKSLVTTALVAGKERSEWVFIVFFFLFTFLFLLLFCCFILLSLLLMCLCVCVGAVFCLSKLPSQLVQISCFIIYSCERYMLI